MVFCFCLSKKNVKSNAYDISSNEAFISARSVYFCCTKSKSPKLAPLDPGDGLAIFLMLGQPLPDCRRIATTFAQLPLQFRNFARQIGSQALGVLLHVLFAVLQNWPALRQVGMLAHVKDIAMADHLADHQL